VQKQKKNNKLNTKKPLHIMKKVKSTFRLSFLIVMLGICLASCKKQQTKFSGTVVDAFNKPLSGVKVEINKAMAETNGEGHFSISTDSTNKYIIRSQKENYGTNVLFLPKGSKNVRIVLFEATVSSVDPTKPIVLTDTKSRNRPGPASRSASWNPSSFSSIPLVYENGKLSDFGFTPTMKAAFDYVKSRSQAGPGISISIPANALVRKGSSTKPSGNVNVSLSTIDLFSAGSMPGDWSVMRANGERGGFMVSFGAGSIEISDEKGTYQLDKSASAMISIPVDTSSFMTQGEIPSSVPLFYFNEETGYWIEDGKAALNKDRTAYEAELHHFSSFNMDIEKTTPACIQIRNTGASPLASYKVEAIVPYGANIIHQERTILDPGPNPASWPSDLDPAPCLQNSNNTSVHMLYNLPENADMCFIFYEPGSPDVPINIAIVKSGATYGSTLPTCPNTTCPSGCADNCTTPTCGSYGTCEFVPFNKITSPLLLAKKKISGTSLRLKYIYSGAAAAITYKVFETTDLGSPVETSPGVPAPPVCTKTVTAADNPLDPKECIISGISAGQHFYKVVVDGTADESPVVDEVFP
jgi:hypothetical protein